MSFGNHRFDICSSRGRPCRRRECGQRSGCPTRSLKRARSRLPMHCRSRACRADTPCSAPCAAGRRSTDPPSVTSRRRSCDSSRAARSSSLLFLRESDLAQTRKRRRRREHGTCPCREPCAQIRGAPSNVMMRALPMNTRSNCRETASRAQSKRSRAALVPRHPADGGQPRHDSPDDYLPAAASASRPRWIHCGTVGAGPRVGSPLEMPRITDRSVERIVSAS